MCTLHNLIDFPEELLPSRVVIVADQSKVLVVDPIFFMLLISIVGNNKGRLLVPEGSHSSLALTVIRWVLNIVRYHGSQYALWIAGQGLAQPEQYLQDKDSGPSWPLYGPGFFEKSN